MATPLETFTRTLLTRHGAIVESTPGGVDVISEPALAATLGLAEFQRLTFTATAASPDAPDLRAESAVLRLDYDSPIVERMGSLVDRLGRISVMTSRFSPPKPIDAAAAVARALTLNNGVVRVHGCEPATAMRVGVLFEYEVLADEREGGLVRQWITPETRSVPGLAGWWPDDTDAAGAATALFPPGPAVPLPWSLASAAARSTLAPVIDDFVERLGRRRDRDARRLREYSVDIDRAIRAKLTRAGTPEAAVRRERDRLDATWQSYRSRLSELADRYRVRVRLVAHGVVACPLPGFHIHARLMRRAASADVTLAWNGVDGQLEARACDGCDSPTQNAWLCDDKVHFLCAACFAPCPQCHKAYCRACHSRCPRGDRCHDGGSGGFA